MSAELTKTLAVYKDVMGVGPEVPTEVDRPSEAADGTIAEMAQRFIANNGGRARVRANRGRIESLGQGVWRFPADVCDGLLHSQSR